MLLAFERLTGCVEARFRLGAGAGDVAPLAERAFVAEEDEGAVDGCALGGVAGEGVGVVEVLDRVPGVDAAEGAGVGSKHERPAREVQVDDGPARAVADVAACVVLAADGAIADAELAAAELERLGSESAGSEHQRAGGVVELANVVAPVGEHDRAAEVAFRRLPPVLEEPAAWLMLASSSRCSRPLDAAWARYGSGSPVAQVRERVALRRVVLAAVLRKADRAEAVAEGGEEAAGADGRELAGVADQDRLPAGLLDQLEQRREDARLRHAGLVDDQHAAARQTALALGVEEEPVHGRAADAGRGCELVGGAAARRGAEDGDAGLAVGRAEHAKCGRLSGAGDADDADDSVAAHARLAHERPLLGRQSCAFFDRDAAQERREARRRRDRPARARAPRARPRAARGS